MATQVGERIQVGGLFKPGPSWTSEVQFLFCPVPREMPGKGHPRKCSKCLFVHIPPTGANCKLDLASMTMTQQNSLEKATTEHSAFGGEDDDFDLEDVRLALDAQRGETIAIRGDISDLQRSMEEICRGMNTLLRGLPVASGSGAAGVGQGGGAAPAMGAGLPPPMHVSDSGSSSDSASEGSDDTRRSRHHHHRHSKKKYALRKFLPVGVRNPKSFPELMSALCRLQAHHVQAGTAQGENLALHLQFLSDRASSDVHELSCLILYDAAVRANAERYGMLAFAYGDGQLINQYLGMDSLRSLPSSSAGGGGGAAKAKNKKKRESRRAKEGAGSDNPCWYYNYGTCTAKPCEKPHVCYLCFAPEHKQSTCVNVRRVTKA